MYLFKNYDILKLLECLLNISEEPVLIIGGGPVGLTLAWRLLQAGVSVLVFEAECEIPDQLRASTFHPPTLDMFEASGIAAEIIAKGRITPDWQIRMLTTGENALRSKRFKG